MVVYRRVYGFGHLRADCRGPRSAPEAYARFEYGTAIQKPKAVVIVVVVAAVAAAAH